MIRPLTVLFVCLALVGCSKGISLSKSSKNTERITEYSEDLSMFRPKYPIEAIEKTAPTKPTETVETVSKKDVKVKSDTEAIDKILANVSVANKDKTEGSGYRIQLFSGNSREEFENAKGYIMRYFPELEIYESYSQPTYRVKIGDFLSRPDADKYYSSLKPKFGACRIVADKINIKKAIENK